MEVLVIVLVAIMLFPPRELPKIARGVAKFYGQIRRTADDFRSAILEDDDLNEPIREIRTVYNEARYEVKRSHELTQREIAKARMEARMAAQKVKDSVDPRKLGSSKRPEPAPVAAQEANAEPVAIPAAAEATHGHPTGEAVPEGAGVDAANRPSPAEGPTERPARERLISATAGSSRPEDAPPGRKPRSKLSMPAGLLAKPPVTGRVSRADEVSEDGAGDDGRDANEADKGVA